MTESTYVEIKCPECSHRQPIRTDEKCDSLWCEKEGCNYLYAWKDNITAELKRVKIETVQ